MRTLVRRCVEEEEGEWGWVSNHLDGEATYPLPLSLLARPRSGARGSGRSVEPETVATMRDTLRKSSVKKSGLSRSFLRRLRLLELSRGMMVMRDHRVTGWVLGRGQAVPLAGRQYPLLLCARRAFFGLPVCVQWGMA